MDPAPELLAGRYRLGGLLGRGGMAEVYDGFDERLARPVAIKILRPAAAEDEAMRQRFEREARSVARLSHPAVVAVYDSGEDHGRAFLVMERLPGETLADRMRSGPVGQAWLADVAADVLGALGAAHALNLVHRDIKPANILLGADGRAKVADFGIAKTYRDDVERGDPNGDDLTATGLILGTVAYLSPEQINGAAASPQADIYALGVVLYEALAGHKPFVGDNPIAQARAVAQGGAPDLTVVRPDIDPRLAAVVRRAMALRVEDRYQSAAAMLADLVATTLVGRGATVDQATVALTGPADTALLGPPPEEATRVVPVGPPPPEPVAAPAAAGAADEAAAPPGRHRGLTGALVALAVVVVAAAVVAVLLTRNNSPRTIPPATTTVPASTTPTSAAPAATTPTTTTPTSTTSTTAAPTTTTSTTVAPTTTSTTVATTTTTAATTTSTTSTTVSPPTSAGAQAPGRGRGRGRGVKRHDAAGG
jgi:tRNA A-37 threonylcarbamoyl transferase component Bud32